MQVSARLGGGVSVFYLVRHAPHDQMGKRLNGRNPGVHLGEKGRRAAAAVAARLAKEPIRAVYTSPLERTRETAEPIAQALGLQPIVREGLHEVDFGAWTGIDFAELNRLPDWRLFNSRRTLVSIPGGEAIIDVQARMVRELSSLHALHPDEAVCIVSHGDPLRTVIDHLLGIPLDLLSRLVIDTASVSVVEWGGERSRVRYVNDTSFLRDGDA